jgi:hypothetical protein
MMPDRKKKKKDIGGGERERGKVKIQIFELYQTQSREWG